MDRINGAGHVDHMFVSEDVPTNRPPTEITEAWLNTIQEELAGVVEAAGIALDANNNAQLLAALRSAGLLTTPAQFDSTTKAATTGFVQRALGNLSGQATYAVNTTLTNSDIGKLVVSSGSINITLPLAAGVPAGSMILCQAQGGNPTYIAQGADTIQRGDGTTGSVTITAGSYIRFRLSGGGWYVVGEDAGLQFSPTFKSVLASPGRLHLPGGFILQWGTYTFTASTTAPVTFGLAFPNSVLIAGPFNPNTASFVASASISNTGMNIVAASAISTSGYWIAIGK